MDSSLLYLRFLGYFELLYLLGISAVMLPATLLSHPLLLITNPAAFRSKWFGKFWAYIGSARAGSPVQAECVEDILARAHGVVLELGPGTGDQMFHYKPMHINRMYAAEPNAFMHEMLLENARRNGLGEKCIPLAAAAQPGSLLPALKKAGLIPKTASSLPEKGVFDSIITIKSLCSVPQEQIPATVAIIQALLKPGGEFLFFEHLANDKDVLTMAVTWVVGLVWPAFMGGCRLDGKLDKIVSGMGGWAQKDLQPMKNAPGFEPLRYIKGICRKA